MENIDNMEKLHPALRSFIMKDRNSGLFAESQIPMLNAIWNEARSSGYAECQTAFPKQIQTFDSMPEILEMVKGYFADIINSSRPPVPTPEQEKQWELADYRTDIERTFFKLMEMQPFDNGVTGFNAYVSDLINQAKIIRDFLEKVRPE